MSEVVISRRGGKKSKGYLMTEYIETNREWKVPKCVDQKFNVRLIGGGSYGTNRDWAGGYSGWMNNDILTLNIGEKINITIGDGGYYWSRSSHNAAGGATSFGSYLSANGGGTGGGGSSACHRGLKYSQDAGQFGGGGYGGNGGVWGGGGGGTLYNDNEAYSVNGGDGGYYGGGGGGAASSTVLGGWYYGQASSGGDGGYYGGGGGGTFLRAGDIGIASNSRNVLLSISNGGNKNTYGGNGSKFNTAMNKDTYIYFSTNRNAYLLYSNNSYINIFDCGIIPEIGTNTIGNSFKDDMNFLLVGEGKPGDIAYNVEGSPYFKIGAGGGGYGGNGGCINNTYVYKNVAVTKKGSLFEPTISAYGDPAIYISGAGGGGYGSNGGNSTLVYNSVSRTSIPGAGGGGYGGDGETIAIDTRFWNSNTYWMGGGGGGGYGKVSVGRNGAGGGYYCPGGGLRKTKQDNGPYMRGGGGGGIGIWDGNDPIKSYGSGCIDGTGSSGIYQAEPGVCIIQYYLKVD